MSELVEVIYLTDLEHPEGAESNRFSMVSSTATHGTSYGLTIVDVVRAHRWETLVADGESSGAYFEVSNVS